MDERLLNLNVRELQRILQIRGLSRRPNDLKVDLVQRLQSTLHEGESIELLLELITNEDEQRKQNKQEEHDSKDHQEYSSEGEFEDSREEEMATNFVFRDVEDALEKFSGEGEREVAKWLENFENIATTCKWNEIQKCLYCRRLLTGAARKAIEADDAVISFELLCAKLKKEFEIKLTYFEVHEKLTKRKKLPTESLLECDESARRWRKIQ